MDVQRISEYTLVDHKSGNLLDTRHSMESNHKHVNPTKNYNTVKAASNTKERKLREYLKMLKEKREGINN